jgi:DNA mismatch endonuclease (patch repair protein)
MPDTYDAETRSRVMRRVKGRDTKPEIALRRVLWSSGFRGYRLHRRDVPGKPDVAYLGRRVAIFVDGAWWHGHPDKWWPGRSGDYWDRKVQGNIDRDRRIDAELDSMGWTVVRLWDFEVLADPERCCAKVASALGAGTRSRRHGGASRV